MPTRRWICASFPSDMSKLKLSMAIARYDRTAALLEGTVQAEGIELNVVPLKVAEIFWRQLHHAPEFDVSELSLSGYLVTLERKPPTYIAIPVFPSRVFRHSSIFINTDSGIKKPADLAGKRVGIPEYSMTAAVFIRGMLQDVYGVDLKTLRYVRGGEHGYKSEERVELNLPPEIRIESAPPGRGISDLLAAGEIDAIFSPFPPASFAAGHPKVARLFPNWESAEREYYKQTRIFPIMHTVVIRREVYEANRWIATSLYAAFEQAKARCYQALDDSTAPYSMPWFVPQLLEQWRFFGCDPYAYGVEPNRHLLETMTRYSIEQGLTHRRFSVDELFAPEMYDLYAGANLGAPPSSALRAAIGGAR
jgi:4,5-dihydroxyphthalate decarboxylase